MQQPEGKNCNSQNEIHRDAANHYNKPLPRRLAPKFIGCRSGILKILIHGFIYHTCNFHIPAQRKPADAVFSIANFFAEDFPAAEIEKDVKFFYTDFKCARGKKVSEFMNKNQ